MWARDTRMEPVRPLGQAGGAVRLPSPGALDFLTDHPQPISCPRPALRRAPIPPKALRTLKSFQTGDRVKVTAPFDQPTETAVIVSGGRSEGLPQPTLSAVTKN